jgi:cysteinyl-tRNA synthetase
MKIFNTLTKSKEPFSPMHKKKVGFYLCGMTVQDRPHLGHMRAYVVGDVIRRYLEYIGYEVQLIQNFTDIDDKIVERARAESTDYRILSDKYTSEYLKHAEALNIKPATFYPRATQHIKEIVELIETLVQKGFAYQTSKGVYYEVKRLPQYGKLSGKRLEDVIPGARVEVDPEKRDPSDFALWKTAKRGEPYWDSPWGPGRPGWHIECSAMSMHYLGETLDIHGGGEDLIFPHHENEIAQAESATGKQFVRYWVHNGLVVLKGEKMSKSTGHFFAIGDILQQYEPNVVRLYLLLTHYRKKMDYEEKALDKAKQAYERLKNFYHSARQHSRSKAAKKGSREEGFLKLVEGIGEKFEEAMDDDFNTPLALGAVFELVKSANRMFPPDSGAQMPSAALNAVQKCLDVLGFHPIEEQSPESTITSNLIELILRVRDRLRKESQFDLADEMRKELSELGIEVEDRPHKASWRSS